MSPFRGPRDFKRPPVLDRAAAHDEDLPPEMRLLRRGGAGPLTAGSQASMERRRLTDAQYHGQPHP